MLLFINAIQDGGISHKYELLVNETSFSKSLAFYICFMCGLRGESENVVSAIQ